MNKDLLASLIFGIGCFLFFVLVVPRYSVLGDYRSIIETRKALLSDRQTEKQNFSALASQYQSQKADIDKINTLLPANKQIDYIVSSTQTAAQQTGMQLNGLTVSGGNEFSALPYKKTFIRAEVSGTYPSLLNFFGEIEKNLRLYDVMELNIGKDPLSIGGNLLNFDIKLNAYNLK